METSRSKTDLAIESVINIINGMGNFATMTRGALGTANGLACEVAPSAPLEAYLDKGVYIPLTLALNGKHHDLQLLSDTMNNIVETLSHRRWAYPAGDGWEIVDITSGNLPRVIGREENNAWIMAGDIVLKLYRKDETT